VLGSTRPSVSVMRPPLISRTRTRSPLMNSLPWFACSNNQSTAATEHAYLTAKGVKQFGGMREYRGALTLPLCDVDRVVVHPNDGAACASNDGCVYIPGPYCLEPLTSIGAGDNFGAGCLAGVLSRLDDVGVLLGGVCASGHFVRAGRSPSGHQLQEFASSWLAGSLPERL